MTKVSLFENPRTTKQPKDYDLTDVLDWIRSGAFKKEVQRYRSTGDKNVKKDLMCFTVSGTFRERNRQGLKKHSGRIAIDFDGLEDAELEKGTLGADPYTEYCFLSCGGKGLCVIVKINGDKHEESFKALQKYYLEKYGLELDRSCKDVSRLRYVSDDEDMVWNPNSRVFVPSNINPDKIFNLVRDKITNAAQGDRHDTLLRCSILVGGYIAGGVVNELDGVQALENAWTSRQFDEAYQYKSTIRDGINNGKGRPLSVQDFYHEERVTKELTVYNKQAWVFAMKDLKAGNPLKHIDFEKLGIELKVDEKVVSEIYNKVYSEKDYMFGYDDFQDIQKVEIFIKEGWIMRKNIITQRVEYVPSQGENEEYDLINIDEIYRQIQHKLWGVKYSLDKVKSLLRSDFIESFDPFKDYFDSLPAYDKKKDYITELASFVKTKDNDFFKSMFKKMLVRSIACSLDCIENRYIFVLIGEKQFTGKSTFIRFLNPFGNKYYTESALQNNKDTEFAFAENFIYNLEELASVSGGNVNRLKGIISKTMIKERKPYATHADDVPRRCNFWGSTNDDNFLTDISNTRWLCFEIDEIDWNYKSKVDIDKVWAQAYYLYKEAEFDMQLTQEEQKKRDIINKSYEVSDYAKELIIKNMKPGTKDEGTFMTLAEVLARLEIAYSSSLKISSNILGKYMSQLGFDSVRVSMNGNQQRGYYVKMSRGLNDPEPIEKEERSKPI
jgi:hypothetical protein